MCLSDSKKSPKKSPWKYLDDKMEKNVMTFTFDLFIVEFIFYQPTNVVPFVTEILQMEQQQRQITTNKPRAIFIFENSKVQTLWNARACVYIDVCVVEMEWVETAV